MRPLRIAALTLLSVVFTFATWERAVGLEIYMTTNNFPSAGADYSLSKITWNGSTWSYQVVVNTVDAYDNLTWRSASGANDQFYTFSASTAALSTLDTTGAEANIGGNEYMMGLAYDRSTPSTLHSTRLSDNSFGSVNVATGAYTKIGTGVGISLSGISGRLAFLGGSYYMTNGSDSSAVFGSVNKTTGVFSTIGSTSSTFADLQLATDGTALYGVYVEQGAGNVSVYSIDTASGSTAQIGSTLNVPTLFNAFGVAMVVPEPGTYALGAVATLVLGIAGRRKSRKALS